MKHFYQLRFWGLLLLVLCLLVASNIIVDDLETKFNWRFDLTASKLTQFSDKTSEVIDAVDEDVLFIFCFDRLHKPSSVQHSRNSPANIGHEMPILLLMSLIRLCSPAV